MRAADHARVWEEAAEVLRKQAKAMPMEISETGWYWAHANWCQAIAQAYRKEAKRNPE